MLSGDYVTGVVALGVILVVLAAAQIAGLSSRTAFHALSVSFVAVPPGCLCGILRTRLDRSSAVETLFTRLPQESAPGGRRCGTR